MTSTGTNGIYLFVSYTGSRVSTKGRGLFTEEETPRFSLSYQFNLCALWRESAARADRGEAGTPRGRHWFAFIQLFFKQDTASCCFQRHIYSSFISLFLGIAPLLRDLCVRQWRGSARYLLERQTLETGVFDQDVWSAVKVHLRVRNILNNLFDSRWVRTFLPIEVAQSQV